MQFQFDAHMSVTYKSKFSKNVNVVKSPFHTKCKKRESLMCIPLKGQLIVRLQLTVRTTQRRCFLLAWGSALDLGSVLD